MKKKKGGNEKTKEKLKPLKGFDCKAGISCENRATSPAFVAPTWGSCTRRSSITASVPGAAGPFAIIKI